MNINTFTKKNKTGKSTNPKTYLVWLSTEPFYKTISDMRAKGTNVKALVEYLITNLNKITITK